MHYVWKSSCLSKIGIDQVVRRCVAENEHEFILSFGHDLLTLIDIANHVKNVKSLALFSKGMKCH